ncbi:MAG: hypothetical protein JO027_18015 [Solirubrobacterales bacterium]|nr:hypothetical protein [Solirubrobacterales bacterium]
MCKSLSARGVALGLAVAAVASLAMAPASFAAAPQPPAVGTNCQPDGKISGAGSTFQANAINNSFTYGFQQDVCGPQPNVANLTSAWGTTAPSVFSFTDAAGTHSVQGMVAYNYSLNGTAASSGSGAGLNRLSCRTDFFSGTDLPYNSSQFTSLKGAPGALPTANGTTCAAAINTGTVPAPFGPQPTSSPPATGDTASTPINFPVAGGAVAYAVNLNGMCASGPPTSISLTADEFNKIWMGTINQWNDSELVATNPSLSNDGCAGNIQRVVRFDNSGTTAITMFTLNGIDPQPNTLCGTDASTTWLGIATSSNNSGKWPQANGTAPDCVDSTSHAAPNPVTAGANGSPALISKLLNTDGGIGYAELGLWPNPLPTGVSFATVQTHDDLNTSGNGLSNPNPGPDSNGNPAFQGPGNPGAASNCKFPAAVPTGNSATLAVGLGTPNWENDASGPLKPESVAFTGAGYPACGLTFDMVQSKIHSGETGEVAAPSGGPFTAGCQIPAESTTTNGDQTLPEATVTVASTAGFPTAGTLNVGGQTVTYTGVTATTFTGAAGGSGAIPSGSAVTLVSTTAPSTSARPGVNGACQTVPGTTSPIVGATDDQLRTEYSYFTYVLSPLGQSYLAGQTLDQLPAQWLTAEQAGFQQNF